MNNKHMQDLLEQETATNNEPPDTSGSAASEVEGLEQAPPDTGWTTGSQPGVSSEKNRSPLAAALVSLIVTLLMLLTGGLGLSSSVVPFFVNNTYLFNDMIGAGSHYRAPRALKFLTDDRALGKGNLCASSKIVCNKKGMISNKALAKMARSDVRAIMSDGKPYDPKVHGKKGYPKTKPKKFQITDSKGKVKTVDAKNLHKHTLGDLKTHRKIFGLSNLAKNMIAGKHYKGSLLNKLKLSRAGKFSASLKDAALKSKPGARLSKLANMVPESTKNIDAHIEKTNKKFSKTIRALRKAGGAYTLAALGCVVVKVPSAILSSVIEADLAQGSMVAQEAMLAPGSKIQSNSIHDDMTDVEHQNLGEIYTTPVMGEDGTMKAVVDAPQIHMAAGLTSTTPPVSDYAPGYKLTRNTVMKDLRAAHKFSQAGCAVILSPAAMWTAMAVNLGLTVAAAGTVIGGLAKGAFDIVVGLGTSRAISTAIGFAVKELTEFLVNKAITAALESGGGLELGEVLGVYGSAIPRLANAESGLPIATEDSYRNSVSMQREYQDKLRDADIATLSPFDTSSQYTFLGNIVYQAQKSAILSGLHTNTNLLSISSSLLGFMGSTLTSSTASASQQDSIREKACQFGKDWSYDTDENGNLPAVHITGVLCAGPTEEFATMSTEEVFKVLSDNNSFNEDVTLSGSETIFQLVNQDESGGEVTTEEDQSNLASCMDDPNTEGDHNERAVACMDGTGGAAASNPSSYVREESALGMYLARCMGYSDGSYYEKGIDCALKVSADISHKLKSAINLFVFDYLMIQSINGDDDDDGTDDGNTQSQVSGANGTCPAGTENYGQQDGYDAGVKKIITTCGITDWPTNFPNSQGKNIIEVNSEIAQQTANMAKALRADAKANSYSYNASIGFRTHKQQDDIYKYFKSGVRGDSIFQTRPPDAARAGYSNHQMGYSIDIESRYADAQRWLSKNMKTYGFTRDVYDRTGKDFGHITNKGTGGVSGL